MFLIQRSTRIGIKHEALSQRRVKPDQLGDESVLRI